MLGYMCSAFVLWLAVATASSCNEASLSTPACANLGQLSYPFGEAVPCAASDAFVISNCSSAQAFWYAFMDNYWFNKPTNMSPPAVMGIDRAGPIVFINLTWNKALLGSPSCSPPLLTSSFSLHLPQGQVFLSNLGSPSFHYVGSYLSSLFYFSPNNIYLLFNCTLDPSYYHYFSRDFEANSSLCILYQQQCRFPISNTSNCLQYKPSDEFELEHTINTLRCSHFQFFVSMDTTQLPITQWSIGLVQLVTIDTRCQDCTSSNGSCLFDKNLIFSKCFCKNNTYSNAKCSFQELGCVGAFSCSLIAKVTVGVTVLVTTLSFPIILFTLHKCHKKEENNAILEAPVQLWFTEDSTGRHFMNELVQGIPATLEQPSQVATPASSTMATMPQTHALNSIPS